MKIWWEEHDEEWEGANVVRRHFLHQWHRKFRMKTTPTKQILFLRWCCFLSIPPVHHHSSVFWLYKPEGTSIFKGFFLRQSQMEPTIFPYFFFVFSALYYYLTLYFLLMLLESAKFKCICSFLGFVCYLDFCATGMLYVRKIFCITWLWNPHVCLLWDKY